MSLILGIYSIHDLTNNKYPAHVHDHAIAIMRNGRVENFFQTERIEQNKHDARCPEHVEQYLQELKLTTLEKEDKVVFVDNEFGRSFCSYGGQVRFEAPINRHSLQNQIEQGRLYWFGKRCTAYVLNHELAHLYSCVPFYGMFKEGSLLVHFDGGASVSNFSAWQWKNNKPHLIEAHYNHKWLSALFNANALVFAIIGAKKKDQFSVPGKFMGLEAYGKYSSRIELWLIDNAFFSNIWKGKSAFIHSAKQNFGCDIKQINNKNAFIQDVAATIHHIFIRESIKIFEELQKRTRATKLYYSGGTALNIKLNSELYRKDTFKEICIPPCCSDSGLALGAAVAGSLAKGVEPQMHLPYLNSFKLDSTNIEYSEQDIHIIAGEIYNGAIIGVCNNYGEIGPRALGNRSIIARADKKSISTHISQNCKGREWYRPIAPIMQQKHLSYFALPQDYGKLPQYMLAEFRIKQERRKEIDGCLHIDGTARIQTINTRSDNAFMYDLLEYLNERYKMKVLVNTSFNSMGKPIVHTPDDAITAARKMKLNGVVIQGKFIKL